MPAPLEIPSKNIEMLSHDVLSLLAQGLQLPLRVTGNSMKPTLLNQDVVWVKPIQEDPRVGDILLYRTHAGQLIAHRVVFIYPKFPKNDTALYLMQGDAVAKFDGFIQKHQILGKVMAREINQKAVALQKRSYHLVAKRLLTGLLFAIARRK